MTAERVAAQTHPLMQWLLKKNRRVPSVVRRALAKQHFKTLDRRLSAEIELAREDIAAGMDRAKLDKAVRGHRQILMVTADAVYAERFFKLYVGTARLSAPQFGIHFHLVGEPSDLSADLQQTVRRLLGFDWFGLSTEKVDFDGFDWPLRARYCQCIRFVRSHEMLAALDIDKLIVTDIDVLFTRDFSGDLARLVQPLSVVMRPEMHDLGKKINAGCVVADKTEKNLYFIAHAAGRMLAHLRAGYYIEKLDQRSIHLSVGELGGLVDIGNIPDALFGIDAGVSALYTGMGVRKRSELPHIHQRLVQTPFEEIIASS